MLVVVISSIAVMFVGLLFIALAIATTRKLVTSCSLIHP